MAKNTRLDTLELAASLCELEAERYSRVHMHHVSLDVAEKERLAKAENKKQRAESLKERPWDDPAWLQMQLAERLARAIRARKDD